MPGPYTAPPRLRDARSPATRKETTRSGQSAGEGERTFDVVRFVAELVDPVPLFQTF
jgi:hypothetical protein